MIRSSILLLLTVFALNVCPVVRADIYKYRDAQGVIRYTYDLAEVPEDQRPQVKTFEESSVKEGSTPTSQESNASVGASPDSAMDNDTAPPPIVDEKTIEELNEKKKELDQEFSELMEQKYKLVKEKEKLSNSLAGRDSAAVAEFDKKVKELNQKIADYEKRQKAFQKEADEVNKAIEEQEFEKAGS